MYKSTIKMMAAAAVISTGFSVAHADETFSKAEINKQIQICSKKKQGDWVTFANKGVTFNGTCEQNENGKLQFSFPAPIEGSATAAAQAIQDRPAQEAPAPVAVPAAPAGFAPGEPAPIPGGSPLPNAPANEAPQDSAVPEAAVDPATAQ